jgi:hypothetical protein
MRKCSQMLKTYQGIVDAATFDGRCQSGEFYKKCNKLQKNCVKLVADSLGFYKEQEFLKKDKGQFYFLVGNGIEEPLIEEQQQEAPIGSGSGMSFEEAGGEGNALKTAKLRENIISWAESKLLTGPCVFLGVANNKDFVSDADTEYLPKLQSFIQDLKEVSDATGLAFVLGIRAEIASRMGLDEAALKDIEEAKQLHPDKVAVEAYTFCPRIHLLWSKGDMRNFYHTFDGKDSTNLTIDTMLRDVLPADPFGSILSRRLKRLKHLKKCHKHPGPDFYLARLSMVDFDPFQKLPETVIDDTKGKVYPELGMNVGIRGKLAKTLFVSEFRNMIIKKTGNIAGLVECFEKEVELTAKAIHVFCDHVPESKGCVPEGLLGGFPKDPASKVELVNISSRSKVASRLYILALIMSEETFEKKVHLDQILAAALLVDNDDDNEKIGLVYQWAELVNRMKNAKTLYIQGDFVQARVECHRALAIEWDWSVIGFGMNSGNISHGRVFMGLAEHAANVLIAKCFHAEKNFAGAFRCILDSFNQLGASLKTLERCKMVRAFGSNFFGNNGQMFFDHMGPYANGPQDKEQQQLVSELTKVYLQCIDILRRDTDNFDLGSVKILQQDMLNVYKFLQFVEGKEAYSQVEKDKRCLMMIGAPVGGDKEDVGKYAIQCQQCVHPDGFSKFRGVREIGPKIMELANKLSQKIGGAKSALEGK